MNLNYDHSHQYGNCANCGTKCDPCNAYTIQIDHHVWFTRSLRGIFTLCAGCYKNWFPWAMPQLEVSNT